MPSIIITSACDQPVLYYSCSILISVTAQHESNIECASFTCVVVDLLCVRPRYQQNVQSDVNNHSSFNVGTASQIVD